MEIVTKFHDGRDILPERDVELEQTKAEVARLSEALKEMAVKLMLVDGKDGWGVCPERGGSAM